MITVVQLRVLRKMVDTNVMTLAHGGAFFRGESGTKNVRKQTIESLEKKDLVEDISDPAWRWRGSEYRITDAGREVVGGYVPSSVRKELALALTIMDEKGRLEGNSRMLWEREWDTVRQCLFDAIELLEEAVPRGT